MCQVSDIFDQTKGNCFMFDVLDRIMMNWAFLKLICIVKKFMFVDLKFVSVV